MKLFKFKMSNEAYDFWKLVVMRYIPAIATLYFSLSKIWALPYTEQVLGTLAAVATFIAACLGISTYNYNAQLDESAWVKMQEGSGDDWKGEA